MRVLVVSNLYPPYYIGGYELACRDVVESLKSRGHEVRVVTSSFGIRNAQVDGHVHRILELNLDLTSGQPITRTKDLLTIEWNNQSRLRGLLKRFKPDVVFFWNMRGFSLSLVSVSQTMGLPSCFYVSDDWLASWTEQNDVWFSLWSRTPKFAVSKVAKPLFETGLQVLQIQTRPARLDACYYAFTSRHMQMATHRSGKTLPHSIVIHHGIDQTNFAIQPRNRSDIARLLYIGRLVPDKGVHTAIEAVHILRDDRGHESITLDIVGTGPDQEYLESLRLMIQDFRLQDKIHFLGFALREDMQHIYAAHDIFIFPSIWEEPFSIVLLEAMASGLPVVGTATGGTPEVLVDNNNSLIFETGNARSCAEQIHRLLDDPDLFDRLRMNGRRMIERSFTFETMHDRIEQFLVASVSATKH